MKKKMLAALLIGATVASCFAGCGKNSNAAGPKTGGKVLNIWVWNEEYKGFFEKYYQSKVPSDVKVNFVVNANEGNNYQDKLDAQLQKQAKAADDEKIDMFLAEADYILKYVNSEYTQDITKLGVTDFSNTYQYTVDACTATEGSTAGQIKGVSFQCCPAGLIYRRSIAKDVLGTDDPAEVQKALDSWSKFDAVAADAKAKGYYMTASFVETMRTFSNNTTKAWVDADNNLVIDDQFKTWMAQAKKFLENEYTLTANVWDAEKNEQMYADGKTMCFFGPAWYYNFSMGNAQDPEKGCYGDWGLVKGPQAYFWGGTWLLAAAGSDNTDIVADIMNSFINDEELCTNLIEKESQFTNNKKVNDKFASDPNYGNKFLGGQNDTAVFASMAGDIKFENKTIFDQQLNEGLPGAFLDYFKGTISEEEAYENFYKVVREKCPGVNIPE